MITRQKYLDKLIAFQDTDLVKVVTGIRRCGKSTLLDMMKRHLAEQGVEENRLLTFKMESMELAGITDYRGLYDLVVSRIGGQPRPYLFFDELQNVEGWEKAVNALRVDVDCDIYVTGSNAFLLSSELATLISGRYVEIPMQPLTFSEYLDFRSATWQPADKTNSDIALFPDGSFATLSSLFEQYRTFGGFPYLALQEPDELKHREYMRSIHQTIIVRDIMTRAQRKGLRAVSSRTVLERICAFLANNVGNETSANKIAGTLKADGQSTTRATTDFYISTLVEAYLFRHVPRYDVKGRELLKTGGKYYIADTGMRSYLDSYRGADTGRVLENLVYNQLVFDDYDVLVGHLRGGEVDFVATKPKQKVYVQVTENMQDDKTMQRELAPLQRIGDEYRKIVVVGSGSYPSDIDGIEIVNIIDFLLHR
ncbi:ATPase [Berryella intestinalis]|uniref:ATPase n=1 Tax=Berryella intestinalis TaxID=1531429 RepID=A0A0A8B2N5_9ACTN|nr:ATP-binding protein [Berryella intestinalis]AJC11599.1 ATPase [Berryella intestinalis]